MKMKIILFAVLISVLLLCGCEMRTVNQMYAPPKRSDDYYSLETVIHTSMAELEYSAPVSGDNRQVIQTVDLNGDEVQECLLFAKGGSDQPLHILVFSMVNEEYVHWHTIDLPGSAFDRVEYAPMDDAAGVEIIVGTQVSDQVTRSVSVFSFAEGEVKQLVTEDYVNFLTVDLNANEKHELFVIHAGSGYLDRGIVELFSVNEGVVQRSGEQNLSETSDNLKRILVGQLADGKSAVYVASAIDEDTLITDVFTLVDGAFTNVSQSSDSGTSVKTMRNYYVYAEDIDSDGIVELPSLHEMRSIDKSWYGYDEKIIRWYSMTSDGEQIDRMFTYHNFVDQWYVEVDPSLADRVSVMAQGTVWDFYIWDGGRPIKVMTIHALTGQNREAQSTSNGRFVLHKTESTIYAASLDDDAQQYNYTRESVMRSFHVIQ